MHRNKVKESAKIRRQSSKPQMNETKESLDKELNEIEAGNLSDRGKSNGYKDTQGT